MLKTVQWLLALTLLLPVVLPAQEPLPPFQQLRQHEGRGITLTTDLTRLRNNRKDKAWLPGSLQITEGKTVLHEWPIEVQTRGRMRRNYCTYPPLKIRFLPVPENDSLAELQEIKMVWACKDNTDGEQLILKEYLMYRLYNLLTEQSFQVQLASLTLNDSGKWGWSRTGFAFFIEPDESLAQRLGGRPYKPRVMSPQGLDSLAFDRMCLFEYMIGNTDWGVHTRHNVRLIGFASDLPVPVPYDFDYSGAVDASYAVPQKGLGILSVKERYYIGVCRDPDFYEQILALFRDRRTAMLQECLDFPHLNKRSREHVTAYLESFFKILDNPGKVRTEILKHCDNFKL